MAEEISDEDFGFMVGFGLVIVEQVSCSCRVSSGENEELSFGIRV